MKKLLILHILLSLCLIVQAQMYSTSPYIQNRAYGVGYTQTSAINQPSYGYSGGSKIGYTTKPGAFSTARTFNAQELQYGKYSSDYRFGYGSGHGNNHGGAGPRKVTVYNGNGETAQTPGGANDPEGVYQYDSSTDTWYYSPDGGSTWYEYRRASGLWELFIGLFGGGWGEQWRTVNHQQTENATNWATDPDDPFLDPIGEPYILLAFVLLYGAYAYRKKKTASV